LNTEPKKTIQAAGHDAKARFARGWQGVGTAIGLELYDQTSKRAAQRKLIEDLTAHQAFPKPTMKNRWVKPEIHAFAAAWLTLVKKDGTPRGFEVLPHAKTPNPEAGLGNLPAQNDGSGELKLESEPNFEKLLDLWQDKLVNPERWLLDPLLSWQLKQLEKNRPWLFKKASAPADDGGDEFQGGVEAVAAYIQLKFPGVICNKMDISNWQRMKFLPDGCTEQFPPSFNSGRNSKKRIDTWVFKYKKTAGTEQNLPGVDTTDYERAKKKLDFERAQKEWEWEQQSKSGKFMPTAVVEAFVEGFGTWIGMEQDKLVEDARGVRANIFKAAQSVFGATPEQLAMLDARLAPELAAANDAMKNVVGQHGDDLFKQMTADRREAIKKSLAN
jgi:hypothetical protein